MSVETRFQFDNRPSLDDVSTLHIETGMMGLIRIAVCVGDYASDDNEVCQGIDLNIREIYYLAGEFEKAAVSQEYKRQHLPESQINDGIHLLEIAPGIENNIELSISYANDPDSSNNNSVAIYIRKAECPVIANALRTAAIMRNISDIEVENDRETGLIN